MSSAFAALIFGIRNIFVGGSKLPDRSAINFDAATFAVTDNPGTGRLEVSVIGGGGGGGGGTTLPDAVAANAVVQKSTGGVVTVAPLTLDQILPAFGVSLAGGGLVDVGSVVATPALTASYSGTTPSSAILSVATLSGGATATGNGATKDVSSTPTSFTAPATVTFAGHGSSASWTLAAHGTSTPTKTSNAATLTAASRNRWGVGAPGQTSAAFILGLTGSVLATGRTSGSGMTLAPTTAQKSYFACRSTIFGTPSFQFTGNFPGGFTKTASAVACTVNGVTETYDLYEADNMGTGGTLLVT